MLAALAAPVAWAQGTPDPAARGGGVAAPGRDLLDMRALPQRPEQLALGSIVVALEARDCPLAVERLNGALPKAFPDVLLLAGAMFEDGICLKPSRERAERFYQRAFGAGHLGGAARLAALHAAPGGNPALALWWAASGQVSQPGECRPAEGLLGDAERYAAWAAALPAATLRACVYAAGVMADIGGNVQFPADAALMGLAGTVAGRFTPARGEVAWQTVSLEFLQVPGVTDSRLYDERRSKDKQQVLQQVLDAVSRRALQRFTRPEGVPPEWVLNAQYAFRLVF